MSHPYSKLASWVVQPTEGYDSGQAAVVAFIVNFEAGDVEKESYQVQVRLVDDGLNLIEFDVHMLGIPEGDRQGKEVVAKWRLLDKDFSNGGTFYTDSNGLEMQKRVLNYRSTFTLDTDMTVSANYYPINTAIAIRDSDSGVQMTVMNDRAQGGSSIENGTIELM